MTEHYMQPTWDASQLEHDAEVMLLSASLPEKEWVPLARIKGWVRRQDV
jgi:hypothetical protein